MTSKRDQREGFLSRWARNKERSRRAAVVDRDVPVAVPASDPAKLPEQAAVEPAASVQARAREDEIVARLPPIESLTRDSDFSVFFTDGIPDSIRRSALRKLWSVSPELGVQDKLDIFIDDYSVIVPIDPLTDTAYKVGRGFCDPEDLMTDEEKEAARRAQEQAAAAPAPQEDKSDAARRCEPGQPAGAAVADSADVVSSLAPASPDAGAQDVASGPSRDFAAARATKS